MSRAAKYRTDIHDLGSILHAVRKPPPAAPAPQPQPEPVPNVYTSQAAQQHGQTTVALGRHPTDRARRLDEHTTAAFTRYAVRMALSRQAAEDPPLFQQLLACTPLPAWPGGEGGN